MLFFVVVVLDKGFAQVICCHVQRPWGSVQNFIVIYLELTKVRLKWVLDSVDTVYSALPIVHENAWRFFQLLLPESSWLIFNKLAKDIDLLYWILLRIRSDKVDINVSGIRRRLLFLKRSINQSTISLSSVVSSLAIVYWHNNHILNLKFADEFPILLWGFNKLYPSTEMSLEEGVIAQHSIALIPFILSLA